MKAKRSSARAFPKSLAPITAVMPALVAGIHILATKQDVDGRDKPGHDNGWISASGNCASAEFAPVGLRFNCQTARARAQNLKAANRRDSSPLFLVRRGGRLPSLFPSHARGERSAERRTFSSLHLAVPRAVVPARAPPGAPQWRFWAQSPCFFDRTGGDYRFRDPGSIGAALHPIASSH